MSLLLLVLLLPVQVRYFQRLPENLKRLQAVAARMAKSGLVSWAALVGMSASEGMWATLPTTNQRPKWPRSPSLNIQVASQGVRVFLILPYV
jgi:hypothetical protein